MRKGSNYVFFLKEVVKFENEVVSEIVVGMVHERPYKGLQKSPHIPVPVLITKFQLLVPGFSLGASKFFFFFFFSAMSQFD
jgi:hypothetical protein